MKNKRILSVILSAVMLISVFSVTGAAATEGSASTVNNANTQAVILEVSAPASVKAGEKFEASILAYTELNEAQSLKAVNFIVDYNDELLELVSVEASDYAGDMCVSNGARYAWFGMASNGISITNTPNEIASATFKVLDGIAPTQTEITITGDSDTPLGCKLFGVSEDVVPTVTAAKTELINNAEVTVTVDPAVGGSVSASSALAPVGSTVTAEGNKLTVGDSVINATADPNYNFVGWLINNAAIPTSGYKVNNNGDITVTAKFTVGAARVTFEAGENGAVDKTSVTVNAGSRLTVSGNKLMNGDEVLANAAPNNGFRLEGWYLNGTKVTSPVTVSKGTDYAFYAKFRKDVSFVTVPAGVILQVNGSYAVIGGEGVTVELKKGDTAVIVPLDDAMITDVYCNEALLEAERGRYTIPAEKLTDDIVITVYELEYEFVTAKQYRALAGDGCKIVKLKSYVNNSCVHLDGTKFYYSSKYNAYVAIVDAELTASEIGRNITVTEGYEAEIAYDGDVNRDGTENEADAKIVNDMLHAYTVKVGEYTDIMRFEADVFGEYTEDGAYVTSADCAWILCEAEGIDLSANNN